MLVGSGLDWTVVILFVCLFVCLFEEMIVTHCSVFVLFFFCSSPFEISVIKKKAKGTERAIMSKTNLCNFLPNLDLKKHKRQLTPHDCAIVNNNITN